MTILHREANRPSGGIPSRYSRHYYDIYCMGSSKVKEKAFLDIELLKEVVLFKDKFYRSSWAKYIEACPGTIKLLPPEQSWSALSDDYLHMQNMIFGDKPSFEEIMKGIKKLEDEINSL